MLRFQIEWVSTSDKPTLRNLIETGILIRFVSYKTSTTSKIALSEVPISQVLKLELSEEPPPSDQGLNVRYVKAECKVSASAVSQSWPCLTQEVNYSLVGIAYSKLGISSERFGSSLLIRLITNIGILIPRRLFTPASFVKIQ